MGPYLFDHHLQEGSLVVLESQFPEALEDACDAKEVVSVRVQVVQLSLPILTTHEFT
jgi:hypothetical protein